MQILKHYYVFQSVARAVNGSLEPIMEEVPDEHTALARARSVGETVDLWNCYFGHWAVREDGKIIRTEYTVKELDPEGGY